jgi:hypothetical protein
MRTIPPSLILLALLPLTACPAADPGPWLGLDTDEDGDLDEDDVSPGYIAALLGVDLASEGTSGTAEDQAVTSNLVSLFPSGAGGAWNLEATFDLLGGTQLRMSMRFENAGVTQPDLGVGTVTNVSANPVDNSWYAYGSEDLGAIDITDTDVDVASGRYEGAGVLEVLGELEQPTGETVTMHAFAFRDAPLVVP